MTVLGSPRVGYYFGSHLPGLAEWLTLGRLNGAVCRSAEQLNTLILRQRL